MGIKEVVMRLKKYTPTIQSLESIPMLKLNCGYLEWGPVKVEFFVKVSIPAGYYLRDRQNYSLDIVLDQHLVKLLAIPQTKPATIYVEDEWGQPAKLEGISKVYQMKIAGSVVYNFCLEGFEAEKPISITNEPLFTAVSTIFIERVLGYVCYECDIEENPLAQYALTLMKSEEVTVILPDEQTTVIEGSEAFFELIEKGDKERVIGKKYTIWIAGSPQLVS